MSISSRIHGTIETWQEEWRDRLKGWLVAVLSFGLEVFMDILGKSASPKLTPLINSLQATDRVPPELQPLLNEIKSPRGQAAAMFANSMGMGLIGGALGRMGDALFGNIAHVMNYNNPTLIFDLTQLLALWLRGAINDTELTEWLKYLGYDLDKHPYLKKLTEIRLDPSTITRIWLRDKAAHEKLWQDLKHQGWDDERIDVLKELANIIPPLADMVRFADYSAFDPEVIAKWREFYDAPGWITEPMSLIGVTGDWANKYWFSHWIQPGRFELGEMHRRGLITDDEVKLAYRTMGYSPYWQDKLLNLVKAVPTRVDVRRWWDMRTISEERLREIYHALGYYDKDLDDYVLWTKVYVAFPDLMARFKNGWITEEEVRAELTGLGMPPERVEEMVQTKIKKAKPERVMKERDLTKTDIYKGVKKGVITWSEGKSLLQELGYDEFEANYILRINVEAIEGSPETYSEFLREVELYKQAQGMPAKVPSEDLIQAERNLVEAKRALDTAVEEKLPETKLTKLRKAVSDSEYHYRQLLTQYKGQ